MSDSTAAPVKGILNAYQRGITLTQRIYKLAQHGSATHTLDTIEPAQILERSLKDSGDQIRRAYTASAQSLGQRFVEEIISDTAITNRLQALTINLQDHFMGLDTYMDNPESFDVGSFSYIRRESERACKQAIHTLGVLEKAMIQAGLQKYCIQSRDRSFPSSQESDSCLSLTPPATTYSDYSNGPSPRTVPNTKTSVRARQSTRRIYDGIQDDDHMYKSMNITSQYADLPTAGSYGTYKEAGPPPPPKSPKTWSAHISSYAWNDQEQALQSPIELNVPYPQLANDFGDTKLDKFKLSGLTLRNRSHSSASMHSPSVLSELLKDDPTFVDKEAATAALVKSADIIRQRKIDEKFLVEHGKSSTISGHLRSYSETSSHIATSNSSIIGNIMDILQPLENGDASCQLQNITVLTTTIAKPQRDGDTSRQPDIPRHVADLQASPVQSGIPVISDDQNEIHPLLRTYPRPTTPQNLVPDMPEQSPTSIYSRNTNAHEPIVRAGTSHSDLEVLNPKDASTITSPKTIDSRSLVSIPISLQIEDGIEALHNSLISDSGIMLAAEDNQDSQSSSTLPVLSLSTARESAPITQESSFYKYGGFCEGAKMLRRGQRTLKVQKKPAGLGFTAVVSMKCPKCTYEIGFQTYEADTALDRSAIYTVKGGNGGLRFRQRFLSKSHLVAKHILDSAYGCLFCVEESRTVDGHDATVFFSVTALLTHIQKHQRPLPVIPGITVLYGLNPAALNFDLCFRDMEPAPDPFVSVHMKLRDRPTAQALVDHRSHHKAFHDLDPDGHQTLQFAVGARIMGVTYPERHGGQWCCGYHDNTRAFFPASMIQLDAPPDAPHPSPKSTLVATAKWTYKAPSFLTNTWLSFKVGERITNINFVHKDFWCWSGMNSKGKYGIFHSSFMKDLKDMEHEREGSIKSIKMPHGSLSHSAARSSASRHSLSTSRSMSNDVFDGSQARIVQSPFTQGALPLSPRMMSAISFSPSEPNGDDYPASSASSVVHPGRRVTESLRPVRRRGSISSDISAISSSTVAGMGELQSKREAKGKVSVFPARFLGLGRSRTTSSQVKTAVSEDSDVSLRLKIEGLL